MPCGSSVVSCFGHREDRKSRDNKCVDGYEGIWNIDDYSLSVYGSSMQ